MNDITDKSSTRHRPTHEHRDPIFYWVLLLLAGFIVLPSFSLDYGVFDSTFEEIKMSMGWSSANISWLWFILPLGLLLRPRKIQSK